VDQVVRLGQNNNKDFYLWNPKVNFTDGYTDKHSVAFDPFGQFKNTFGGIEIKEKIGAKVLHPHPNLAECRTVMEDS